MVFTLYPEWGRYANHTRDIGSIGRGQAEIKPTIWTRSSNAVLKLRATALR